MFVIGGRTDPLPDDPSAVHFDAGLRIVTLLEVLAVAGSHIASSECLNVIRIPENYGALSPLLHVVPLQLLAYHTACARGTDVDKPRNLAKSVTVE